MRRFPFEPPPLQRFVDPDKAIDKAEQRVLGKALDKFEKRFPQVTVTVCVIRLPEDVDGREFGFWYLNRSQPKTPEARDRQPYHILLIVDRSSGTLSATVGYGLDPFLDDITLTESLTKAELHFANQGYAKGIARWLKILGRKMGEIHKDALFAIERWQLLHTPTEMPPTAAAFAPTAVIQDFRDHAPAPLKPSPRPPATTAASVEIAANSR